MKGRRIEKKFPRFKLMKISVFRMIILRAAETDTDTDVASDVASSVVANVLTKSNYSDGLILLLCFKSIASSKLALQKRKRHLKNEICQALSLFFKNHSRHFF